jgi:predicted ATPase
VPASIRTPDQRLRIFVSSTLQEVADERVAAKEAIQRIRLTPVMFEMGARPHPPRDLYRAYLAQSDVFVGIYWQRYGWIAPGEAVSGLEDEYLLAADLPKLIYIKRADKREERLDDLIHRIQDADRVSYRPFTDASELEELIANDLALMLTEHFDASGGIPTPDPTPLPGFDMPARSAAPVERGELIGREPEVALVSDLLQRADTGLITLTGPGGTGKTRLATHVANTVGPGFGDGAFYVPLAGVREAHDVVPTITSTLDIPAPPTGADPEHLLIGFLRARHALLVLDNLEQVLDAAPDVARLLGACPDLKIIATSREPLHIRGEREVPVPPLPHRVDDPDVVTPAMRLFESRARDVRPDFTIDDDNRAAVAELCRRLDALPLAIELAAARVRVLSPQAMLTRLDESLSLLSGGQRDRPERHQTLRATLEWSLALLQPEEQRFFRRLGVFADSFSESAAAAVVGDAGIDVLDGVTSLVEKSLLVRFEVRGDSRFRMLETVREFARDQAAAAGDERAARLRHAQWVERLLAGEHANLMNTQTRQAAHERIAAEEIEARRALRFAASDDGDAELAWQLFIRFGVALISSYAQTAEVLSTYERMAPLPRPTDPRDAAIVLGVWSWARASQFDPAAGADLEVACAMLEEAGDREFLMCFESAWGMFLAPVELPRALEVLGRAIVLTREANQTVIENYALLTICLAHLHAGTIDEAQHFADEMERLGRRRHDDETLSYALVLDARIKIARGDIAGARRGFADAVALASAHAAAWSRAMALCGLASATMAEGDEVSARAILEEALLFCVGAGYLGIEALCGALALLLLKAGEPDRARRVFDAVARGTEEDVSFGATATDQSGALRAATREARDRLGDPPACDPAALDLDAVLEAALGHRRHGSGR